MAKVLLVEDDNNLREIYQARLMAEGYDIVAAQNGEEALVVAKQNKPDLIISDVMMPRISGFEMLDILRNTDGLKHTPVIMLTALGQTEDQKRANNLGADKYLVKSQVTLEDIVAAAKELLEGNGLGSISAVPPAPAGTSPSAPAVAASATPVAAASAVIPVAEPPAEPGAATPAASVPAPAPTPPASVTPQPVTPVASPAAPSPTPPSPATPVAALALATPPAPEPATAISPVPKPLAEELAAEPTAPAPAPSASTPEAPADPALESKAQAAVTDTATQSLEAEEAALQAQIASYAKEPGEDPPAVDPATAAEAAVKANNDEAINEAVEELHESTPPPIAPAEPPSVANVPAPTPPTPAPAPAAATAPVPATAPAVPELVKTSDNVNVAGKKVISPISDPAAKPNLDVLLAKEAAATPPPPPTPVVDGAAITPPGGTVIPQTPGQGYDPNTVAL
jgi:CheY-like chemotaxis protein